MNLSRLLPRGALSFRALAPRINPPLLPLTRLGAKQLTRTPRISSIRLFHPSPSTRLNPTSPISTNSSTHEPLPPNASFGQRLKHLVRAYGWYAVGVYAVVGILDFGISFASIYILGAEYVSSIAAAAKAYVFGLFQSPDASGATPAMNDAATSASAGGNEGLYAMLVLAYTLHKTVFLPVRIGVTTVYTPRIVHWLRARGWAGSTGTRTAIHDMRERIRHRD